MSLDRIKDHPELGGILIEFDWCEVRLLQRKQIKHGRTPIEAD